MFIATAFFRGVSGFAATLLMNDKAMASDGLENLNIVSQGITAEGESLSQVSFNNKIKFLDKTSLPFEVEFTSEEISSLLNNENVFHRNYIDKTTGKLLELQVTDADIVPMGDDGDEEGLIDIELNGGMNAQ